MLQDFWAAELAGGQQGPAGSTPTITAASILDPYVLLLLSDGTAALLYANAATGKGLGVRWGGCCVCGFVRAGGLQTA